MQYDTENGSLKDALIVILKQMPKPNYYLLYRLASFLYRVSLSEGKNKMSINNLALVFGPNLLRYPTNDVMEIMRRSPKVTLVISIIIQHYSEIFSDLVFTFFPHFPFPFQYLPPLSSFSLRMVDSSRNRGK